MKEKLDPDNRMAIVNYRLERAHETLKEADFAYCDLALVNTLRPRAEAFIEAVEKLTLEEK
ncbi:hypothetical protein [Parabacteroides sp.]